MTRAILAIDQGTTNTKALLIDGDGVILARASVANHTSHPQPGWAEQDPEQIWSSVRTAIGEVIAQGSHCEIAAIGLTNQRESVMLWDRETGRAAGPCILWQCRRTADRCLQMQQEGLEAEIASRSGLALDPLFSATKIAWLIDALPDAESRIARREICAGTVDSWLLWKLTGLHAIDIGNASRTQLLSLETGEWDQALADPFGVPLSILPDVRPSDSLFGYTNGEVPELPGGIPIYAVMGDSHAAVFGHGIETPGRVKVTIGTGSSLMTPTSGRVHSKHGLSSTIGWGFGDEIIYALEGNIANSGGALSFAANLLGVGNVGALADLAGSVSDNGGVCFLPALAGLGAPYWRSEVRGMISGMSNSTQPAHVARAAFEAVALQINDVFQAIEADLGTRLDAISVDGGGAANEALLQLLADILDRRVDRTDHPDVGALGVARVAGRAVGMSIQAAETAQRFTPAKNENWRLSLIQSWGLAIERASYAA